jgi:hypothetical protein
MARAEKMKAIDPPMSTPMKVVGCEMLIEVDGSLNSALPTCGSFSCCPMVSMNEANRATEAMTADPMATPLVTALVVLPTASRETMTRSASPVNSPDISATPAALSETGPKLSSETIMPAVDSRPMPVRATK